MNQQKKKTIIVGIIIVGIIVIVFVSTLFTHYMRSHKSPSPKQSISEMERVDITLDYMPQIDWADMALFFNISNVRAQKKKSQVPFLGSIKFPTIVVFDIEANKSLEHPLFLAHFLDSQGHDVMRSQPVQIEPENNTVITSGWKPGNKGIAYFVIDKEKLSRIALIKVMKRIKH
jgi:hypothetical protein